MFIGDKINTLLGVCAAECLLLRTRPVEGAFIDHFRYVWTTMRLKWS